MLYIDIKENNTFKNIKKYKIKKYRDKEKKFLAEGIKFLDFKEIPEFILINENYKENKIILKKLEKFNNLSKIIILSDLLFSQLTTQKNSQGIILVYKYKENDIDLLENNIVILDRIADPGNLGTIIRTVDAAGFKDIILVKGSVDAYNEKVIRSTMGSIFNVNLYYMEEEKLLNLLKEKQYKVITTALHEKSVLYTDMKLAKKNAIVFGNEGSGVSENFIKNSKEKVIIPLVGTAESLNIAIACGIIIYKVREKIKI